MTFKTLLWTTAGIVALSLAGMGDSFAANPLITAAEVNITEPISIIENNPLRFGSLVKPSAGTQDFIISAIDGTTSVGPGDGLFIPLTGKTRGDYSVSGVSGAAFSFFSVASGICSDPGLTLSAVTNNAPALLNATVLVGGTLNVASTVPNGPHTCPYTVSATY